MKQDGAILRLSATDLAGHLACSHLTQLDRLAADGRLRPPFWRDPMLEILEKRGLAHEAAYLDYIRKNRGREVVKISDFAAGDGAVNRTVAAMREGVSVIAQAPLRDGRWYGRADVLLRTDRPSDLGGWSCEVVDTKLASKTRGGTVLQ